MTAAKDILKQFQNGEVKYLDLRFTDPKGKLQHLTLDGSVVNDELFADGAFFDGSSISGWKAINESDMVLMPDPSTTIIDPFTAQPTMIVFCDILDAVTKEPYERDPRGIARRAEEYLKTSGIGDTIYMGPEAEFFVFDDVKFQVDMNKSMFEVDSVEGPYNSGRSYESNNLGHRPGVKGGYFPVPPIDSAQDLRTEFLEELKNLGLKMEKHHHEVAPSQHELGLKFNTLLRQGDAMQLYKYGVHMVANAFGKSATFMPKPIKGDNGTGMHTHQSIWKDGNPLFAGDKYAGLSEVALYYIGGIIKHGKALNAFTNASTNSYKRLIPGFEAPVILVYSSRNRSASCRIPISNNPSGKRVEVRFPDPSANPYLAFSSMLMAGLDGIKNKIDPGAAADEDLYELSDSEVKKLPTVCGSLREALETLDEDRAFLTEGNVFSDDQINAYIELKMEEVYDLEHSPHPIEYKNYFSV